MKNFIQPQDLRNELNSYRLCMDRYPPETAQILQEQFTYLLILFKSMNAFVSKTCE